MNTGLGLNFLRIVNEEGSNGWSQIYARVPFDDVELRTKGALFGAVFGGEVENWADLEVEMTTWIDEYFNGINASGDLGDFFGAWRKKYSDLSGVWLWVRLLENNRREIKIVKWGTAGVYLKRGGNRVDLMASVEEGKVIRGSVDAGDVLYMWSGVLGEKLFLKNDATDEEERVFDLGKELTDLGVAASGLILRIDKMFTVNSLEDTKTASQIKVIESEQHIPDPVISEDEKKINEKTVEIIRNRYVGPIGIKEKLLNWWSEALLPKTRTVRVGEQAPKRKKVAVIFGFLFLILLLISLISGSIKMKGEAEDRRWRGFYEPIEKGRQEALSLSQLNPVGARKMMEEVKTTFDLKKVEFLDGKHKNDVSELERKINEGWLVTSGERSVEIEEIAKIDLVRAGFVGDRIAAVNGEKMLAVDNVLGVGVIIGISTKDIRVVAGKKEGEKWIDVTGDDKKTLIMSSLGIKNAESSQDLIVFDAAVAGPVSVGRFMENVYVLDQVNKEIYKYSSSGETFGSRTRWLKQGLSVGMIPVDMAIDADIWTVSESGQVEKYRRGSKEPFFVAGLPAGVKVSKLAVEVVGGRIALLDQSAGMVLICNKDNGNCSQQLKSERIKTARDLEFGSDGSLYVLFPGLVGKLKQ